MPVLVSGGLVLAVVFLSTPASMTAEPHDRVIKQLDASGACGPPGRRFHPCFGSAHHLTVFDVWDCAGEFPAFGMTLMPSLADEELEMAPAEPLEIHRLIEGGDASVLRKAVAELRNTAFLNAPSRSMAAARRNPATSSPPHGSPRCAATNAGRTSPTPTATAGLPRCCSRMLRTAQRSFSRVTSADARRRRNSHPVCASQAPRVTGCGSPVRSVSA